MVEYIERDWLLHEYDRQHKGAPGGARKIMETAPAADGVPLGETCPYFVYNEHDRGNDSLCRKAGCEVEAVQRVVRGRWKTAMLNHEAFGERPHVSYCSVCNQIVTFRTFFCPNCGADMRGDNNDNGKTENT